LHFRRGRVIDRPVLALVSTLALALSAPPPQGHTIRLPKPSAFGATAAEAEAVQTAVRQELEAEGYAVVTSDEAKGHTAIITGTLTKVGGSYIVNLSIIRESDHRVLDNVRQEAKSATELPKASTDIAKQLASALRLAMGVRAKVKLK
jgi:hypothetical protein